MAIIILPPLAGSPEVKRWAERYSADRMFLSNPVVQKRNLDADRVETIDADQLGILDSLTYINWAAKNLATSWHSVPSVRSIVTLEGIDLAGLFYIEDVYYFIGLLKAIKISERLLDQYRGENFFLADDGSYWSDAFKLAAARKGTGIDVFPCAADIKENTKGISLTKDLLKFVLSKINMFLIAVRSRNTGRGRHSILYSCAPRFSENIWNETCLDAVSYFLRPVFSLKVFRRSFNKSGSVRHILPGYFLSGKERRSILREFEPKKIFEELDSILTGEKSLLFEGYDLWPVYRRRLRRNLDDSLVDYALMTCSMVRMLRFLAPGLVVTDEDTTPFNKALVEVCGHNRVKTVQLNHGILGHSLLKIPINSDIIAAYGDSSRKRLEKWGVPEEKIVLTGAPVYSVLPERAHREKIKSSFFAEFDIPEGCKIVTLATSPFRTEERADFMDSFLTPERIGRMIEVAACFLKEMSDREIRLIIKFHPREKNEWFTRQIFEHTDLKRKVIFLKRYNLSNILFSSDLVLTYGTTVYYDAMLMKVPVVLFDSARQRNLSFLSESFLDLETPLRTARDIRSLISDPGVLAERLSEQNRELEGHFIDKNRKVMERIDSLFSSLLEEDYRNLSDDK